MPTLWIDSYRQAVASPIPTVGLDLWLDAADTSTITDAGGGAVSLWVDKTGNGHDVAQATSGSRPTTGTRTINGLNTIDFDGTADHLFNTSPFIYDLVDCTVFVVAQSDSPNESVIFGEGQTPDNDPRMLFEVGQSNIGRARFNVADNTATNVKDLVSTRAVPIGAAFDAAWEITATTIDQEIRKSAASDTYVRGTTNLNLLGVGAWVRSTPTRYFNGAICEIIVYDGILSAPDKAMVQSYLRAKWGITCPTFFWATSNSNNLSTIGALANPTGAATGDLVYHIIAHDNPGATNIGGSTGWQASTQQTQGSNVLKGRVFARRLDGSGDDTFTPSGAAQDHSIHSILFKDAELDPGFDATDAVSATYCAGAVSSVNGDPDPPNLDTGVSREYLWIAAGQLNTGAGDTMTGDPTGYTPVASTKSNAGSASSCFQRTAVACTVAQSEDPGPFAGNDLQWIAFTLAVVGA